MMETRISEKKLRDRVMYNLATSPATLLPFLAGTSLLLAGWALGTDSGVTIFAGLACLLGSVGVFLTRMLFASEGTQKRAIEELRKETDSAREEVLDQLFLELRADGDPRTEGCLQDLRALMGSFRGLERWSKGLSAGSTLDILEGVESLFQGCVRSLERSLDLWKTANSMADETARLPLLDERVRIIGQVQSSNRKLGQILAEMARLESTGAPAGDLERIRRELDESLEIARRVDERMRDFGRVPDGEFEKGAPDEPGSGAPP